MCVYEQCMSMCTCTRIDAASPWWQGAAPTWTLEVLKLRWHPQIRWISWFPWQNWNKLGKVYRYRIDTGIPPCSPRTPDPSGSFAAASCCAFSCLLKMGREEKSDFFFGQTGHATILLRFLQNFSVIFPSKIANPIVILADDPKDTSLICTWNASSSQLLGAVASPPGSSEWSFDFGVVMIIQWTNIQNSLWLHGCFRAFMGVFSLFTHAESCWSILDISGYLLKVCPRPAQIRLTLPGCFKMFQVYRYHENIGMVRPCQKKRGQPYTLW